VRLAPLLNAGAAILSPDHLPGSWNPRPAWQRPRAGADRRQVAAWAMRTGLVLLYWADRLDAVVCTSRDEVIAAVEVALGHAVRAVPVELPEASGVEDALGAREQHALELCELWSEARRLTRRRPRTCLDDVVYALGRLPMGGRLAQWRAVLGPGWIPEPAMLIRRVLNGQDPERQPALPRRRLRRRPLCLLSA
jgi:hypothetical protein